MQMKVFVWSILKTASQRYSWETFRVVFFAVTFYCLKIIIDCLLVVNREIAAHIGRISIYALD